MLTNPQIIERLQTQANTVLAARQAFEAKRDEVTALRAEIALHRKGAEAADSEARGIREETAGLLRALAGQLTKHFRDLKAKERAAYTLAEDFRELVANLEQTVRTLPFEPLQWFAVLAHAITVRLECRS